MGYQPSADNGPVDLVEAYDDHGNLVWINPADAPSLPSWAVPQSSDEAPAGPSQELVMTDGGMSLRDSPHAGARVRSVVPRERMAGALEPQGWDRIPEIISDHENSRSQGLDIAINPGGRLTVERSGQVRRTSVVPDERMAADPHPRITVADVDVIRELDPFNQEAWEPVYTTALDGWRFRLQVRPDGFVFKFLAFRSPTESNRWRLSVLSPDMGGQWGHGPHIVTAWVGGREMPVLCGRPGQQPGGGARPGRQVGGLHPGAHGRLRPRLLTVNRRGRSRPPGARHRVSRLRRTGATGPPPFHHSSTRSTPRSTTCKET